MCACEGEGVNGSRVYANVLNCHSNTSLQIPSTVVYLVPLSC